MASRNDPFDPRYQLFARLRDTGYGMLAWCVVTAGLRTMPDDEYADLAAEVERIAALTATPPPTADLLALVREIAASDPMQDHGDNRGTKECRYCEQALVSQTFTIEEDGKTVTMDRFDFRPELRVHKPDCFWVRARALVARLDGKENA